MATNNPRHGYERKRSQLKTKTMTKNHPYRSALGKHVHRTPRLGNHGLLNARLVLVERGRQQITILDRIRHRATAQFLLPARLGSSHIDRARGIVQLGIRSTNATKMAWAGKMLTRTSYPSPALYGFQEQVLLHMSVRWRSGSGAAVARAATSLRRRKCRTAMPLLRGNRQATEFPEDRQQCAGCGRAPPQRAARSNPRCCRLLGRAK